MDKKILSEEQLNGFLGLFQEEADTSDATIKDKLKQIESVLAKSVDKGYNYEGILVSLRRFIESKIGSDIRNVQIKNHLSDRGDPLIEKYKETKNMLPSGDDWEYNPRQIEFISFGLLTLILTYLFWDDNDTIEVGDIRGLVWKYRHEISNTINEFFGGEGETNRKARTDIKNLISAIKKPEGVEGETEPKGKEAETDESPKSKESSISSDKSTEPEDESPTSGEEPADLIKDLKPKDDEEPEDAPEEEKKVDLVLHKPKGDANVPIRFNQFDPDLRLFTTKEKVKELQKTMNYSIKKEEFICEEDDEEIVGMTIRRKGKEPVVFFLTAKDKKELIARAEKTKRSKVGDQVVPNEKALAAAVEKMRGKKIPVDWKAARSAVKSFKDKQKQKKGFLGRMADAAIDLSLEWGGLLPVIGSGFDVINAVRYVQKGRETKKTEEKVINYFYAAMHLAAAVPGIGDMLGLAGKKLMGLGKGAKISSILSVVGPIAKPLGAALRKVSDLSKYIPAEKVEEYMDEVEPYIDEIAYYVKYVEMLWDEAGKESSK
jgi:hypothetical protein